MLVYVVTQRLPASDVAPFKAALAAKYPANFQEEFPGLDAVGIQVNTSRLDVTIMDVVAFFQSLGYSTQVFAASSNGMMSSRELLACAVSGEYFALSDLWELPDGRRVCVRIYNQNSFTCDICGARCNNDVRTNGPNSVPLCVYCYEAECGECHECGGTFWNENLTRDDGEDETHCYQCNAMLRGDGFTGCSKTFSATNSFGSSRHYGIELETNGGTASDQFAYGATDDGSIDGWEFVSHKLRGDEGLEETRKFMDTFDGVRIGDNCGFHLHFSAFDLTDAEKYGVYAAYLVLQDWFFAQVNRSRQGNSYCRKFSVGDNWQDLQSAIAEKTTFKKFTNYWDRYGWINLGAFCEHGTIENRLHHAVREFEPVRRWVILNLRFVRACREHCKLEPSDTPATFKVKAEKALAYALQYFGEAPATGTSRKRVLGLDKLRGAWHTMVSG
jgi:hypothetical protein